jgi:hypothetical protein
LQYEKIAVQKTRLGALILSDTNSLCELPIWDQRELLSLYYPACVKGQTTVEKNESLSNVYQLDFVNMIENLDIEIKNIFWYLGLTIQETRADQWKQIYIEWKHKNNLNFFKNLDKIIQCILTDSYHSLAQYNMSFAKEIVIASKLLYNHNLTLKSYGKINLSQNTKQWSEILETNTYHNLTKSTKELR